MSPRMTPARGSSLLRQSESSTAPTFHGRPPSGGGKPRVDEASNGVVEAGLDGTPEAVDVDMVANAAICSAERATSTGSVGTRSKRGGMRRGGRQAYEHVQEDASSEDGNGLELEYI